MAKAYTLSNGQLLVGVDNRGHVRDVYFPRVGLENHVSNKMHRVGVFVDGVLHWLDHSSWVVDVSCSDETLAGSIVARNDELGVTLHIYDVVYNEKNIFLRQLYVTNERDHERDIKLFFGHEFRIWESSRGDTAYYDPRCEALVHYKGRRVFLMNAQCGEDSFDQYATGLFDSEGKEGAHRDAEDGELSMNPVEHGSVDSVMRLTLTLKARESKTIHYWLVAGRFFQEVQQLNAYVLKKTPAYLMRTASDYWRAWVGKQGLAFEGLPQKVVDLFNTSLLIIRAHTDTSGAIIASSDTMILNYGRDNYSYMWPRDGAYAALALTMAGDYQTARTFFEFCNDVITEDGYFMHKYLPDGSVGSSWHPWVVNGKTELPIQTDETAIVLVALKEYYHLSRNLEFIERVYNTLISKSADFLASYVDEDTGLPHPSYDLWEEKYGIHTYTCATTYGALKSAAFFADLLGKRDKARRYLDVAESIKTAMLRYLYDEGRGVFIKSISHHDDDGLHHADSVIDMSSTFGIYAFGVLPVDDIRVVKAMETLERELALHEGTIGGVPRYQGDNYYRVHDSVPPNPWTVTTLWRAQYDIMKATSDEELEPVRETLSWVQRYASSSGVLSEQLHPYTGAHLGAAPLTWSHSEVVIAVIRYLQKLEDLGICETCYPLNNDA